MRSTATNVSTDQVVDSAPRQLDFEHLGHGARVWRGAPDGRNTGPVPELAWFLGAVVVCGGLLYLAHRIEPHWVAKDGTRFITTAQPIDRSGSVGRPRPRGAGGAATRRGPDRLATLVDDEPVGASGRIQAKAPTPPRGRQLYLLRPVPDDPMDDLLTLRLPSKSSVVPTLDAAACPSPRRATRTCLLRLLVEKLADGAGELIQVDQESVVSVR